MNDVSRKGYIHITLLISGSSAMCSVLACIMHYQSSLDRFFMYATNLKHKDRTKSTSEKL